MSDPPSISVIIPAYNSARTLPKTLQALILASPPPDEVIVVDDGSRDKTALAADVSGVKLLRLEQNCGAAVAKNMGAAAATSDILFFTDSDIVPPMDLTGILQKAFRSGEYDGIVGLLSEDIPHHNWASQFKNLWMNFTYSRFAGADRIGLFYTSAAAIKRTVFADLKGFDENYRGASIAEDTDFGQRAWGSAVRIRLVPELRVTHVRAYSTMQVLEEDFKRARALSLMRFRKRGQPFFTSVPLFYQLAVPTIYLTLFALLAGLILASPILLLIGLIGVAGFYILNVPFLSFLFRKRGLGFALTSALFLPADVLAVGLGIITAVLDLFRGVRY